MAAGTEVELINEALARIGADRYITSLTDGSPEADEAKIVWPGLRNRMLRIHDWKCNSDTVELAADVTAPIEPGWTYRAQIPANCLKVVNVVDENDASVSYRLRGRYIHYNSTRAFLKFRFREEDVSNWDSLLYDATTTLLAARFAVSLRHDMRMHREIMAEYSDLMPEARGADSQERSRDAYESNDLIDVRAGSASLLRESRHD